MTQATLNDMIAVQVLNQSNDRWAKSRNHQSNLKTTGKQTENTKNIRNRNEIRVMNEMT
jgi:hypothetical protein